MEGKLIPPWTDELAVAYEQAKRGLENRELVIHAKNVTEISEEGESSLVALINEGARFHCCGVYTKRLFRQLTRRAREFRGMEK